MRINEAYKVRQIAGENIVMTQGKDQVDLTQVISLNETSLWLWQQVANREFSLTISPPSCKTVST